MDRDLPKAYDPTAIEDRWAEYWVAEELFHQPLPPAGLPSTSLYRAACRRRTLPASCTWGTCWNTRRSISSSAGAACAGISALWVPGTDHAGIAHADHGGAPVGRGRQDPPGTRPGSLHRTRLAVEAALRKLHPGTDEAAGRERRLGARVLHHGRQPLSGSARGLCPAL